MTTSEKSAKLTTRELPQKSKNANVTVRENNGLYSIRLYKKEWNICLLMLKGEDQVVGQRVLQQ